MKKIKKTQFRRLQIIKLSGAYYVNSFVEKSIFITVEGVKFFKVSKSKLRAMGVIFAEDRAAPSQPPSDTPELPALDFPHAA
jgi:hypothetical protein